jgi:hypothetical protein
MLELQACSLVPSGSSSLRYRTTWAFSTLKQPLFSKPPLHHQGSPVASHLTALATCDLFPALEICAEICETRTEAFQRPMLLMGANVLCSSG